MSEDGRTIRDIMFDAMMEPWPEDGEGVGGYIQRSVELVLVRLAEAGFVVQRSEPMPRPARGEAYLVGDAGYQES